MDWYSEYIREVENWGRTEVFESCLAVCCLIAVRPHFFFLSIENRGFKRGTLQPEGEEVV
jgi:hypothetical protein